MVARINNFLDQYVLPWPVRFLTFRFVILATICLLVPLLVYANHTALVLAINSYLNTMSVAVSSIVLLYATLSDAHQRQIAELQERRAQEDHDHVTEMHTLVLQALANQHDELEQMKRVMAVMQGKQYQEQAPATVPDLQELHPRGRARFDEGDTHAQMDRHLHRSRLAETMRRDFRKS